MTSADFWRGVAALPTAIRIDRRRPASWIALASAAITGWALAAGGGPFRVPAGIAAGGLLAVAAVGRLPGGVPGGERGPWAFLAWERAGWPVAGFLSAGVAALAMGGGAAGLAVSGAATAFCLLATALVAVPPGAPRTPAVAASLALTIAGAAAAAAAGVAVVGLGPLVEGLVAAAAWGLLVASLAFDRGAAHRDWLAGTPTADRHRAAEPGLGLAMSTALVGMAGCFFLAPRFGWAYAVLALGWLVCLVAPLLTAVGAAAAECRLARSTAGRAVTPGGFPQVAKAVGRAAAVLAWPAAVAATLAAIGLWQGGGAVWALAWLAGGAGLILLVAAAAGRRGETAQAVILALAAGAAAFAR